MIAVAKNQTVSVSLRDVTSAYLYRTPCDEGQFIQYPIHSENMDGRFALHER